jgi:hypothetical protein
MFFYETKMFRYFLILTLCAGGIFRSGRCYADVPVKTGFRAEEGFSIASENKTVDNLFVEKKEEVSLATTLLLDFTLPGGGHFYRGDFIMGTAFLTLKIAGGFMAYYFVKNWKESEENYNQSKSAGISADELENERRRYDRSAQYVTFTAALNLLVYGVSALINYNSVMKTNERAFPAINISLSGENEHLDEFIFYCEVSTRM